MYVMSNPRMHWSLHAHGSADALSALGNDMAAHPQALFETAVATAVDATTMTYYGKATLTRGEQVNAILKLCIRTPATDPAHAHTHNLHRGDRDPDQLPRWG